MTMIPEMDQQAYLDRMLGALRNTEDKSPNSFSYDNLSAVAFLAEDIHRLIVYLSEQFDIDNLEGQDLETRVYQIAGLTRKQPLPSLISMLRAGSSPSVINMEATKTPLPPSPRRSLSSARRSHPLVSSFAKMADL